MKYLITSLKQAISLICFSFALILVSTVSYAAECNPNCPNGCNPDGSCKIIDIPMEEEDEIVAQEEVENWVRMDDELKEQIAKDQARYAATQGDEEATKIYNEQQRIMDQQKNNQSIRDSNAAAIEKQLNEQKAQNDKKLKDAEAATQQAQKAYEDAQKQLQSATTPEDMKAANEALKKAKENLENAQDTQKDVKKDVEKANKALDKEAEKKIDAMDKSVKEQQKALEKAQKEQKKAIEKEQEQAEDDLKDANKKIKKLEERCAKGKCDDEDLADLAAARQAATDAQAALDAANQKAAAFNAQDDDLAAAEYIKGRDAEIDQIVAEENALAITEDAGKEFEEAKKDIEEAQSAAPKMCSEVSGNIFLLIACKAMITLADLRIIAYIISGFGMIALAFAAIFGKMNFKHLANIGIGLFLLSMMTPFIEYFTTGKDGTLMFGKYLPAGFTDIQGSDGQVYNCGDKSGSFGVGQNSDGSYQCPEVTITAAANIEKKDGSWSFKDLKSSIQSGMDAIRSASDMYKAAKSTVTTVTNAVSNMSAQIKAGGGGLDGIINAAGAVANATGTIVSSGQSLANNIATNAGTLSTSLNNISQTTEQLQQVQDVQKKRDALSQKCSAGNCSATEQEQLKKYDEFLDNETTSVNKWLQDDGKGGGSTILSGINKVSDITNKTTDSVRTAANAAHEGQAIGGDGALGAILGVGMGVGTAVTEGMDMAEDAKKNGTFDFRSEETKREEQAKAEQEAFEKTAGYVKSETQKGDVTIQNLGDGSIKTIDEKSGISTMISPDGTTTITNKDGSTIVKNKDGTKVVTDAQGNKITYDAAGNITKKELTNEYNRPTAESMEEALKGKKKEETAEKKEETAEKKEETAEKKVNEKIKEKRRAECQKAQSAEAKAACEQCAEKDTQEEYASCITAYNKKAQAQNDANECGGSVKLDCFGAAEGSDKELTAKCKKCGFRMATSVNADTCKTLKADVDRAKEEYSACTKRQDGKSCDAESEKASSLLQQYKKQCPNG